MDLYIQKYMSFAAAVECGSFTKAAEKLNYSQSGISRMIADLEKEWKITLLERSKSGVRLTPEGKRLLPYAQQLLKDFEKLQMEVDDLHDVQSGLIRIGTISSIATYWLPEVIADFQKEYPGIEYEILMGHYAEIEQWIEEGRVDIGFLRLPARHMFETKQMDQDQLYVILPEGHPLADEETVPVTELTEYPFILLEKGEKEEISAVFDAYHLHPDIKFTTVDDYAAMAMVEKGLGISILPGLILQKHPFRIVIKSLNVDAHRSLGYAVKQHDQLSLAAKRFIDFL